MKKRKTLIAFILICVLCIAPVCTGCTQTNEENAETAAGSEVEIANVEVPLYNQAETKTLLMPQEGTDTQGNKLVTLDVSHTDQGYLMVKYLGENSKIKVQLTKGSGATYTYDLNARDAYEIFPLSEGSGSYSVKVFENISGTRYSQAYGTTVKVELANEFLPFLYPNQYVNYNAESKTVAKGIALTKDMTDDYAKVEKIYNYVVNNFSYDYAKAKDIKTGYLPEVDTILASRKGICFDYASVMTTMLRTQNIPTKLVVGYTGNAYHAWINVYLEEEGWIDGIIFFDGKTWELMDPTFASSGRKSDAVMKYINDSSNYKAKYAY